MSQVSRGHRTASRAAAARPRHRGSSAARRYALSPFDLVRNLRLYWFIAPPLALGRADQPPELRQGLGGVASGIRQSRSFRRVTLVKWCQRPLLQKRCQQR